MISGIHHLNFLVKDLEQNARFLQQLLLQSPIFDELPQRHVKTASFTLGQTHIVLVSPTAKLGEPAKILAERGEGLFLVSMHTNNLDQELKRLEQQGISPNSALRQGLNNWQVIDLKVPAGLGPIFQLCQHAS